MIMISGMRRRLEKYYLFCNSAFLSLFTMKFVRFIHATKYTLSWNKKRLQNMSEIFDMVHMSQVGNLAEISRDFRDIIS